MPVSKKRKKGTPKDVRRAREKREFLDRAVPLVERVQRAEEAVRRAPQDAGARQRLARARAALENQVMAGGLSAGLREKVERGRG